MMTCGCVCIHGSSGHQGSWMIQETFVFGPTWSLSLVFWTLINRLLFCPAGRSLVPLTFLNSVPSAASLALSLPPWLRLVTRSMSQHVFLPFSRHLSYHLGLTSAPAPALETVPASLSEYGPASRFPNAVPQMRLNLKQKFIYLCTHHPLYLGSDPSGAGLSPSGFCRPAGGQQVSSPSADV